MICPHCGIGVSIEFEYDMIWKDKGKKAYQIRGGNCPECDGLTLMLDMGMAKWETLGTESFEVLKASSEKIIFPLNFARKVEKEVPENFKRDFLEACNVLPISPKASAALSRRILQQILHDEYKIKCNNLVQEIEAFINRPDIPSHVKDTIDAVRNFGNFAAHPTRDALTGEIIDVEVGEADWLIEVLETLFDITFVQPKRTEERKKKLNEKLSKAGKPPMKTS